VRVYIQSRSDRDRDEARRLMWGDHWVKRELSLALSRLGLAVAEEPDHKTEAVIHLFGSPPRRLPARTRNLVWLYSHPDQVDAENLRSFEHVFCASPLFVPRLKALGYDRVSVLPACTAKKPLAAPLARDLVFLGNARQEVAGGRAVVRDLGETARDFKVWGSRWEKLLPARYYGGPYWAYERLEELYASARITLTDHHPDMAREGFVSNKVFDVLASGGFVISDENRGLRPLFGEAVPEYTSAAHLRDLIDFYLGREDERQRLMLLGRSIALAHTYQDRAETFRRFLEAN
jgi:hypothetical protein